MSQQNIAGEITKAVVQGLLMAWWLGCEQAAKQWAMLVCLLRDYKQKVKFPQMTVQ